MDDHIYWLLTFFVEKSQTLCRVAVAFHRDDLPEGCREYPMEGGSRLMIFNRLPSHLQNDGIPVNVEELSSMWVAPAERRA